MTVTTNPTIAGGASSAAAGGTGGTTVAFNGTSLTLNSGNTNTYNGNTIAATNAAAQTITINSGAALTGGFMVEQLGAGIVSIAAGGGVTLNAPNGLASSGARTTLIVLQESTDVYTVLAAKTSDNTLAIGAAGAAQTIDFSRYNVVTMTLSANLTITFTGAVSGQHFATTAYITQDAVTPRTVTVSPTPKANAGSPWVMSSGTSKEDVVTFATRDGGTTIYAFVGGQGMA